MSCWRDAAPQHVQEERIGGTYGCLTASYGKEATNMFRLQKEKKEKKAVTQCIHGAPVCPIHAEQ